MSPTVELSANTFKRLQHHAVPLVDTIETIIIRMLDAYDKKNGSAPIVEDVTTQGLRAFNPDTPPNLAHTKVLTGSFANNSLNHSSTNWNGLLNSAIREAKKRAKSKAEFQQLMTVNYVEGSKLDEGYKPLAGTGISVQGQDSNSAWRAAHHIAKSLGCDLYIKFAWREKEDAAFPGLIGTMTVIGK